MKLLCINILFLLVKHVFSTKYKPTYLNLDNFPKKAYIFAYNTCDIYYIYNRSNYSYEIENTDTVENANYNRPSDPGQTAHRDPIRCIHLGLSEVNFQYIMYESSTTTYLVVSDSSNKELHDYRKLSFQYLLDYS
ncbi:hypothetical protein BCR36DRAFT_369741 [Piromyces finnis]|uniref:Uncharacterized protein n=1 Tax=Piromyces finnis TaxID=1754191 RepID=A0A1Y1VBG6_9FUNG|nr:hypothetical protein BCR36DRAFT_369741 [Piromyces finnis]|eukprot:ORX51833.1 hypothetical protein BCR36DRAFT_369741 [Piromyces finnis]